MAPTMATALHVQHAATTRCTRRAVGHGRRATVTRAGVQTLFTLAEEAYKYGEVNAPVGAVVGGAVVVTAVVLASTFAFKSGFEAQDEMAERDKETFNKKRPQRK